MKFVLLVLFLLYLLTKNPLVGLLFGWGFLAYLLLSEKKSFTQSLQELIFLGLSFVAYWFLLSTVLRTEVPIAVIASCSMLPQISRGDVVFIGNYGEPDLPEVALSSEEIESLTGPSLYSKCLYEKNASACEELLERGFEERGGLRFVYGRCRRGERTVLCVKRVEGKGVNVSLPSGRVMAFKVPPEDLFGPLKLVVHRAFLRIIGPNGSVYYLTKGDNSEVPDILLYLNGKGNSPVPRERVLGEVFLSVPAVGYLKLLPLGLVEEDPTCSQILR